jgi:ankyrin repeat protein
LHQELEILTAHGLEALICAEEDPRRMPLLMKWCIEKSSLKCLELMTEKRFRVDCEDGPEKNSPLHIAARNNDRRLVEFFLNLGVTVDSKNGKDQTPYDLTTDSIIKRRLRLRALDQV